jgi:uncharacterized protein YecE (DUF72 family)
MANWIYYEDVDFTNEENIAFHIDTRDFYCLIETRTELENSDRLFLNLSILENRNNEDYRYTEQELKNLIEKLWRKSGCDGE